MRSISLAAMLALCIDLAGCSMLTAGPKPGKITLTQAMQEVANGLNEMYDIRKHEPKSGLMPSEVTIVFNVSASTSDEGKLYVEAGANPADVLKVVKAGGEASTKIETSRGNQVTVKFINILFAPKDTLVTAVDPKKLDALFNVLKGAGLHTMMEIK